MTPVDVDEDETADNDITISPLVVPNVGVERWPPANG
jgi:hypothetical protein